MSHLQIFNEKNETLKQMEQTMEKLNNNLSHPEMHNEENATMKQIEQVIEQRWLQLVSSLNIQWSKWIIKVNGTIIDQNWLQLVTSWNIQWRKCNKEIKWTRQVSKNLSHLKMFSEENATRKKIEQTMEKTWFLLVLFPNI